MSQDIHSFVVEKLKIKVFPDRKTMGKAAGEAVAAKMIEILHTRKELFMVFASAPSQEEFLEELSQSQGIAWNRITAFHLDEYIGLPGDAPQNFGHFLRVRLFDKVKTGRVYYINGMAKNPEDECKRYTSLLKGHPLNIACVGIGENGHLAFNDPPVADFNDPLPVKAVDLDPISREQQVHDKTFQDIESVPLKAITLTIPTVFSAKFIYCMVPAPTKAEAVRRTLEDPISTHCPATILRRHENATLFLDKDSARLIQFRKED
ncbi:MAG: glucosamine-6-phosphate deaminase [Deltaproteobacteria bacterium RBG_16_49_23]|nr:MAG: glucosamine-6-phosphate deaminase [Deltaproteobacteria bacterium RBG_16_49_23]